MLGETTTMTTKEIRFVNLVAKYDREADESHKKIYEDLAKE